MPWHRRSSQESVMSEKEILLMLDSPFIIRLYETYNSSGKLYFLMDYYYY